MMVWSVRFGAAAMTGSLEKLQAFLSVAVGCRRYEDLRAAIMGVGDVVPAPAWGITRLDERQTTIDIAGRNVTERFLATYESEYRGIDPVLAAVLARQSPAHNLQTGAAAPWYGEAVYRDLLAPSG